MDDLAKEFEYFCVKKRNKKKAEVFIKSWLRIGYRSFPRGTYLGLWFDCGKSEHVLWTQHWCSRESVSWQRSLIPQQSSGSEVPAAEGSPPEDQAPQHRGLTGPTQFPDTIARDLLACEVRGAAADWKMTAQSSFGIFLFKAVVWCLPNNSREMFCSRLILLDFALFAFTVSGSASPPETSLLT